MSGAAICTWKEGFDERQITGIEKAVVGVVGIVGDDLDQAPGAIEGKTLVPVANIALLANDEDANFAVDVVAVVEGANGGAAGGLPCDFDDGWQELPQ